MPVCVASLGGSSVWGGVFGSGHHALTHSAGRTRHPTAPIVASQGVAGLGPQLVHQLLQRSDLGSVHIAAMGQSD